MTTTNHTSPSGEDAANGVITRDEAIRMVKEYARSLKDERNDQTAMRFWHIVNLLSGGYAQAPSAGKVAAEPVAERTERPFNQGPYGAFTPTAEGTEKAREFLIGYMRSGMGNGIYDNFIRYELASDFAWNLANGLNALTAEKVAAEPVATLHDDGHFTWHGAKPHDFNYAGWRMKVYAAPQPAQTQVALTDDARDCLADVVSHYRALYAGLAFQLNEATVTENADDMAYWKHEIKALERMYAQAERALLAAQPVSGGKL